MFRHSAELNRFPRREITAALPGVVEGDVADAYDPVAGGEPPVDGATTRDGFLDPVGRPRRQGGGTSHPCMTTGAPSTTLE